MENGDFKFKKLKKSEIQIEWWWGSMTLSERVMQEFRRQFYPNEGDPDWATDEAYEGGLAGRAEQLWEGFKKQFPDLYEKMIDEDE